MSLEAVLQIVLGVTPVPGLSPAFTVFKFIVSSVQAVQESKKQLEVLATAVGQLLATLNSEFRSSRLIASNCRTPLADLKSLLEDIHRFVHKEQNRGFFKSLLNKDSRIASMETFYRRIGISVNAFQISGLLSIQSILARNQMARKEDTNVLNARLKALEQNQVYLRETLDIKQNNMIAMMACIQRRLDGEHINPPEQKFYSHTLQYLTSMSGQQVKLEDWMIASFDVDYGPEIGFGGFGKVYRGTWNRTDVAIKVLHSVAGVTPSPVLLRQEIDIWLTLRHPNILQFLGANTLDDKPFIVMPYIPNNARQFLKQQPAFDPVYILRDISLGLQYLHSRKICHGDIKGINILVEDSGRSLLCDFGLSRVKANITTRTAQPGNMILAGSRNWMAPELLAGSLPMMTSDIYAFGMTMYELYTDEIPLASVPHTDFIELVFRLGIRPTRPDIDDVPKLTDHLWNLAELCWFHEAKARPTIGKIHDMIEDMISQMSSTIPAEAEATISCKNEERSEDPQKELEQAARLNSKLLERTQALGEDHPETACIMIELASVYNQLGQFKEAEVLGIAAMEKGKQVCVEDDLLTLHTMSVLVNTLTGLGRAKEAEELGVQVMKRLKKALGEDHPSTLEAMNDLAIASFNLGQFNEAKEVQMTLMKKQKQILGEDHPNTLLTMSNLAETYLKLWQHKEAEELALVLIEKQKKVLGEEHPSTLKTMSYLAVAYCNLGQFKVAKELEMTLLKKQKQVLGDDHPDTLLTMSNLARTYRKVGQLKQAEELAMVIIQKQKQVLGEDYPSSATTLKAMSHLAVAYFNLGQFEEAKEVEVALMKKRKKVLGEDHPDTLQTMSNLANTSLKLGQLKEAAELSVAAMRGRKKILGEDHPLTLKTMNDLATAYHHLGRLKEAKELGVALMKKQKQVLGEDHPDTLLTMSNLAIAYFNLGQLKEAKDLTVTMMKKRKRVFGEDHPITLKTMSDLASICLKLGQLKEAEELVVAALQKRTQILGEGHPDTLRTMNVLVSIFKKLGKLAEAQVISDTIEKMKIH